jgi:hypothetical protein
LRWAALTCRFAKPTLSKVALAWAKADYYAVRPDDIQGPRWSINIQIVPVIPGLF